MDERKIDPHDRSWDNKGCERDALIKSGPMWAPYSIRDFFFKYKKVITNMSFMPQWSCAAHGIGSTGKFSFNYFKIKN